MHTNTVVYQKQYELTDKDKHAHIPSNRIIQILICAWFKSCLVRYDNLSTLMPSLIELMMGG